MLIFLVYIESTLQSFFYFYLQGVSKQQDTCYQHTFHLLKCPTNFFILSHEKTKKPQHRSLRLVKPKAVGFTNIRAHPRLSCTAQGEAHGPTLDSGCLQTLIIQEWHRRKEGSRDHYSTDSHHSGVASKEGREKGPLFYRGM